MFTMLGMTSSTARTTESRRISASVSAALAQFLARQSRTNIPAKNFVDGRVRRRPKHICFIVPELTRDRFGLFMFFIVISPQPFPLTLERRKDGKVSRR